MYERHLNAVAYPALLNDPVGPLLTLYVTKKSSCASAPIVSTSAETTLRLTSFSTRTMSTSRPGRSAVLILRMEHEPLGASVTSIMVGTTLRMPPAVLESES